MIDTSLNELPNAQANARVSNWKEIISARGERYAKLNISDFDRGDDQYSAARNLACQQVGEYCNDLLSRPGNDARNLVFVGPSGTGKDFLMFCALRRIVFCKGLLAAWSDGQRLFSDLRSSIAEDLPERELIRPLIERDLLAISDPIPPAGTLSDYQRNILFLLLDERYSKRRPIWMTVNARTSQELDDKMGVPLVDRMLHDAVVIKCYWPSYRRLAA